MSGASVDSPTPWSTPAAGGRSGRRRFRARPRVLGRATPYAAQVASRSMGLILTATAGLCLWIVLWALGSSGFDAIMIAVAMVLLAIGFRTLLPHLPGRRD